MRVKTNLNQLLVTHFNVELLHKEWTNKEIDKLSDKTLSIKGAKGSFTSRIREYSLLSGGT